MRKGRLAQRGYKYSKLLSWGLEPFEASDIAEQYTMAEIRHLPYLVRMIRWRRLYVANLKKRGWSEDKITIAILGVYDKHEWLKGERPDIWAMIRAFRQEAIDRGEYTRPKKGSHHKGGISKGQIDAQRLRRKRRLSELEKYDIGRGR